MAVYEYKGVNATGKVLKGVVEAENPQVARARLRKDSVFVTEISEGQSEIAKGSKPLLFAGSVKTQDVAIMTRQLSTLLSAGIPLVESLAALVEQTENVRLKRVVSDVREKVNEGASLADALRGHPEIFSNLFSNMVMAGESSGTLDLVLDRLADFTEGQMKLRNKILQVMAYPALMVLIGIGVMMILFTFVIPKVTSIYSSIDAVLPTPTILLIGFSTLLTHYWYVVPATVGLIYWLFMRYRKTAHGRFKVDQLTLKIPMFGQLIRMMSVSRFSRTLGTLISAGVPLLTALDITKNVINNVVISQVVEKARRDISEGESVSGPLQRSGEFPPMVVHMIAVGERTGALDKMLLKISDVYDNQVDSRIVTLTSLLEPIMIVGMAVSVGFIVMAVLLPLLELTSKINI